MSALADFRGEIAIIPWGAYSALVFDIPGGVEVICQDRAVLHMIADALERRSGGPLLPVSEFTRLYYPFGDEAHLKHPAAPGIFCDPDAPTESMYGSGSTPEEDHAASLPLWRSCTLAASGMRAVR